jgi:hypothetical protein
MRRITAAAVSLGSYRMQRMAHQRAGGSAGVYGVSKKQYIVSAGKYDRGTRTWGLAMLS